MDIIDGIYQVLSYVLKHKILRINTPFFISDWL